MPTIPAPKQSGDCRSIGGLTVCPHVVYLTKTQTRTVHKMHARNVAKTQKTKNTSKALGRKKKRKTKGRSE
jgi:hypothetical protein